VSEQLIELLVADLSSPDSDEREDALDRLGSLKRIASSGSIHQNAPLICCGLAAGPRLDLSSGMPSKAHYGSWHGSTVRP
jgi:hypothetical protein